MTDNLFDATLRVARNLGTVSEGSCSAAGTTVTLVDAVDRLQAASYWVGGPVWITYDAGTTTSITAPAGRFSRISASTAGGTITVSDSFTAATATGDLYAIGKKRYDLFKLRQNVNRALIEMGPMRVDDITTTTTASSKTEYTLPKAAGRDLREVWIQGRLNDSNDNRWNQIFGWKVQKTITGTADELILPFQYSTGRLLKLVYATEHPELMLYSDEIDEDFHLDRIVIEATVLCLMWRKSRVGDADPSLNDQLGFWINPIPGIGLSRLERVRLKYPVKLPPKSPDLLVLGGRDDKDNLATPTV